MQYLSEEERQLLLKLIDVQCRTVSGRLGGDEFTRLTMLRRKIEGVDKRIAVEG